MRRLALILAAAICTPALAQQPATSIALPNYTTPDGNPRNVAPYVPLPLGMTPVDGSGTVTTGGTSQQVFPARATRIFLFCQNPTDATEKLVINLGAAAAVNSASIELAAGGTLTLMGSTAPVTTVNVTAATTGHRFICKEAYK